MLLPQVMANVVVGYAVQVVLGATCINAGLLACATVIRVRARRGSRAAKRIQDAFPVFIISMPALTHPIARSLVRGEFDNISWATNFWLLTATSGLCLAVWFVMCALWMSLDRRFSGPH